MTNKDSTTTTRITLGSPEAEPFDLEHVLDDQIAPIVRQLHDLCMEHDLPMVCAITFASDDEGASRCKAQVFPPHRLDPVLARMVNLLGADRKGLREGIAELAAKMLGIPGISPGIAARPKPDAQ